jgi:hypothetical protein
MTETECSGNSTTKLEPVLIAVFRIDTTCGFAKLLAVVLRIGVKDFHRSLGCLTPRVRQGAWSEIESGSPAAKNQDICLV